MSSLELAKYLLPQLGTSFRLFRKEMSEITGLPETDLLVLLQLDDLGLGRVCQTSSYLNSLCQNEHFWYLRTLNRFGPEVIRWKPQNETYRQQYLYLTQAEANEEARKGRLDAIIALNDRDHFFADISRIH